MKVHRLFGLLWPVLAMSNGTMAQAQPGAAASHGTLQVDMTPLAKSYQSMEIDAGFHNNCTGTKATFKGSLRGGIPDGEGELVPDCDIPVDMSPYSVPESCSRCTTVKRWTGLFQAGNLPFGQVDTEAGWTYYGPLFNLLPHGSGVVTDPDGGVSRQRFAFGRRAETP